MNCRESVNPSTLSAHRDHNPGSSCRGTDRPRRSEPGDRCCGLRCLDVQAKLDDLAATDEGFTDTPWIPDELSLAVRAALGCGEIETG